MYYILSTKDDGADLPSFLVMDYATGDLSVCDRAEAATRFTNKDAELLQILTPLSPDRLIRDGRWVMVDAEARRARGQSVAPPSRLEAA